MAPVVRGHHCRDYAKKLSFLEKGQPFFCEFFLARYVYKKICLISHGFLFRLLRDFTSLDYYKIPNYRALYRAIQKRSVNSKMSTFDRNNKNN